MISPQLTSYSVWKAESTSSEKRNKTRMPTLATFFPSIVLEVIARKKKKKKKKKKKVKGIQIGKEIELS